MAVIKVNKFEIHVGEGYPVWITLRASPGEAGIAGELRHIKHTDLRDLEYAVQRAIVEARRALRGTDKAEVD